MDTPRKRRQSTKVQRRLVTELAAALYLMGELRALSIGLAVMQRSCFIWSKVWQSQATCVASLLHQMEAHSASLYYRVHSDTSPMQEMGVMPSPLSPNCSVNCIDWDCDKQHP